MIDPPSGNYRSKLEDLFHANTNDMAFTGDEELRLSMSSDGEGKKERQSSSKTRSRSKKRSSFGIILESFIISGLVPTTVMTFNLFISKKIKQDLSSLVILQLRQHLVSVCCEKYNLLSLKPPHCPR